ncbi:MAG: hypothetical protein ABIJ08_05495 [Nanoarchaeota archaeon]
MPDKVRLKNTNSGFLVREVAELGDKTGVEDLLNQFNRYQEKKKKREGIEAIEAYKKSQEISNAVPPYEYLMGPLNPLGAKVGSLLRGVVQRGVGRVVTNVLPPVGYTNKLNQLANAFSNKKNIKKSIRAIIDDKPSYIGLESEYEREYRPLNIMKARDLPYRKMFGLEPRYDADQYVKNADGSYSFDNEYKARLEENYKWYKKRYDEVMGDFDSQDMGDSTYNYYDKWDFAINKGEKGTMFVPTTGATGFLRRFIDTITDPVTIKGQIDLRKKK